MAEITKDDITRALQITVVVAECIREAQELPSGHLYAMLMDKLDIHQYEAIIRTLKRAKLVDERAHWLRWIGPNKIVG